MLVNVGRERTKIEFFDTPSLTQRMGLNALTPMVDLGICGERPSEEVRVPASLLFSLLSSIHSLYLFAHPTPLFLPITGSSTFFLLSNLPCPSFLAFPPLLTAKRPSNSVGGLWIAMSSPNVVRDRAPATTELL